MHATHCLLSDKGLPRVITLSLGTRWYHRDKNIKKQSLNAANTGHSPNVVSMVAHRLRRWPNIETALGECPVFAGNVADLVY